MPAIASPSEAPTMLASASGVSTTRSGPYLSTSPLVVRKTPPSLPTSRPRTITRGSASISSASALLMASTMLRCATSGFPVEEVGLLPRQARGQILIDVREDVVRSRRVRRVRQLQRAFILLAQLVGHRRGLLLVPQPEPGEVALRALDRVAGARLLVLLRVLVARGVVGGVVEAHAVGDGLDERRTAPATRALDRLAGRVVDGHHVVAIHLDAYDAVAGGAQRKATCRGLHAP